ncbi:MAG TPA: hypothetical protein VMT86_19530 [Bryobacteraceae bacterium]|nr:hypothetical protein [Bryobacteraceae bacterium]
MSEDVFRWVVAVGVLLACAASVYQAIMLAVLYRAGKEALRASQEVEHRISPLIERFESILNASNKLLEENRPRIGEITTETLAFAKAARQQADRLGELIDDANRRAKARIAQIDEVVDHTVGQVEQASETVRSVVMRPVKEVNGLVAGFKAAFSTYAQGGTRNTPEHVTQDEEMFI